MKQFIIYTLLLVQGVVFANSNPNDGDYTYQKDLKVSNVYQLTNRVFVPQEIVESKTTTHVEAGKVRILIGSDMVAFKGVPNLSAFGIVSKLKTPYGYELKLVDNRGTDMSTLAVETDAGNYVETLYFESKRYGDFEFRLPQKSSEQEQSERKYFTAKGAYKIFSYQDLNGKILKPAKRLDTSNPTQVEEKVYVAEKFSFQFDTKKLSICQNNKTQTFKVRKAAMGLENVKGKQMKVLRLKTNKRAQTMTIYLNDNNQIEHLRKGSIQYFFL